MMEIWILASRYHFSPEYVDSLPPVERQVYIGFGIEEEERKAAEIEKHSGEGRNYANAMDLIGMNQ